MSSLSASLPSSRFSTARPCRPGVSAVALLAASLVLRLPAQAALGILGPDGQALAAETTEVAAAGAFNGDPVVVPPGLTDVVAVAAGDTFDLLLHADGSVSTIGEGLYGETVLPPGLSGVTAVAAGAYCAMALKSDGTVAVWGDDSSGQVSGAVGLTNVKSIAAGGALAAVKTDGSVVVWGPGTDGELAKPADLGPVAEISAGDQHFVALMADQTVRAWGSNASGQSTVPGGLSGVTAVAAGSQHSLARKSDGTVLAWGANDSMESTVPAGLTDIRGVIAGGYASAVLLADGSAKTWDDTGKVRDLVPGADLVISGDMDFGGHSIVLGRVPPVVKLDAEAPGTAGPMRSITLTNAGPAPVTVTSVTVIGADAADFAVHTAGMSTVLPALTGSAVFTVNFSPGAAGPRFGQVRVTTDDPAAPVQMVALAGYGGHPDLAVEQPAGTPLSGTVTAWGSDLYGQATPPVGLSGVVSVAAGEGHALALLADGTVVAWGDDLEGQASVPVGLAGVVSIAAGREHSVALRRDGTVVAWGKNSKGQASVPAGLAGVVEIAANGDFSAALTAAGEVKVWGDNAHQQQDIPRWTRRVRGLATTADELFLLKRDTLSGTGGRFPYPIPEEAVGIRMLAGGEEHMLALLQSGTVVGWGESNSGQANVPEQLTGVRVIAAGTVHSMALRQDGTVVAWGQNTSGQRDVPPGLAGVRAIAGGGEFSVALVDAPRTVDFGTVSAGSPGATRVFALRNPGTAPLTISGVSISGAAAADFSVNAGVLPVTLAPGSGVREVSVTFSPASSGAKSAALRVTSNDEDRPLTDVPLTGTGEGGTDPRAAWRQTWFGSPADSGDGADLNDFDHDGLANLVEFAFGLNPRENSAGQLPVAAAVTGGLEIRFTPPVGVGGVRYTAEWSPSLTTGSWSPVSDTGVAPERLFRIPLTPGTKGFLRLKVSGM